MPESYKDYLASQQEQAATIEPAQPSYKNFLNEQKESTPESGSYKDYLDKQSPEAKRSSFLGGAEPRLAIDSSIHNIKSGAPIKEDPFIGALDKGLETVNRARLGIGGYIGENIIPPLALESEFLSEEEIQAFKAKDAAKLEAKRKAHNAVFREADTSLDPSFTDAVGKGVTRGVHGIGSTFAGLLGMGSDVLGDTGARDFMSELSQEQAGFAQDIKPEVHPDSDRSLKDKAVGVTELVSEQLPNLALTGGGGFVGGTAAKTLVTKGMTTLAKKKIIEKGAMLGTTAVATAMESAGNYNQILQETGKHDVGTSAAHGLVSGWLEALPVSRLMGKAPLMDKMVGEVTEDIIQKGFLPKLMDLAKVIPEQGLTEGVTEGMQTIVGRHALEWMDKNKSEIERIKESAFTPEARAEIAESAKQGATVGAVLGGAGSLTNIKSLEKKTPEKELTKLLENSQISPDDIGPATPVVTEGEFDSSGIDESELRLQESEAEAPFIPSVTESIEPEAQIAPELTTETFTEGERALAPKEAEEQSRAIHSPTNQEKFFTLNRKPSDGIPSDEEVKDYDTLPESEKNRGKVRYELIQKENQEELVALIGARKSAQKNLEVAKGKHIKKAKANLAEIDSAISAITKNDVINIPQTIDEAGLGKKDFKDQPVATTPTPKKQPIPEIQSFEAKPFQTGEGVTQSIGQESQVSPVSTTEQTIRGTSQLSASTVTRMEALEADLVNMSPVMANKALKVINIGKAHAGQPLLTEIPQKQSVKPAKIKKDRSLDQSKAIKNLDTTLQQLEDRGPIKVETRTIPEVVPPITQEVRDAKGKGKTPIIEVAAELLPASSEGKLKKPTAQKRIEEEAQKRIEATSENISIKAIKDSPFYHESNKKENIAKAVERVNEDPEQAFRDWVGNKDLGEVLKGSMEIALTDYAVQNKDYGAVAKIARVGQMMQTRSGQEVSIYSELDVDSPTRYIEEVRRAKVKALGSEQSTDFEIKATKDSINKEIKKAIKKSPVSKGEMSAFLADIKC